ncbi:MAG: alpha/beta hydrolase [Tibeticola sp.]
MKSVVPFTPAPRRAHTVARLACAAVLLAVSGCATIEGVTTATLAGRTVEHVVKGQGQPAVVLENGLGGRLQWWNKVLPEVARETTVFAYNRAGTGDSESAAPPRDGAHIVEELRHTLRAAGLAPPYVLVGSSLGGLYVQLYARRHPEEVAGLVLVDSTHPLQLHGAGALENWPAWLRVMLDSTASPATQQELDALDATGKQVLALPPYTAGPVVVLSAAKPMRETSTPLARDSNAKRADIVRLYPGAQQVWVDSGHVIQLEKPEAVVAAVHDVLARLRGGSTPAR